MLQEEFYDADEILRDVDSVEDTEDFDEMRELSFESPGEGAKELDYLVEEVDRFDEFFAS